MKSYWVTTIYITVLASFGYFATDIYLPSLPAIAIDLQVGEAEVQTTMVAYLLSFSLTPLLFGPLSDQFGRKRIILIGLAISLVATLGCYFSISLPAFLFFRALQGLGAGATVIASRTMVPDLYQGKELARQYSYITTGMPLILAIAPALGGLLQEHFNWQAVFIFLTFYICVITLFTLTREESLKTPRRRTFQESCKIYKEILTQRSFLLYGLGMTLPSVSLFGYLTASPFLFQEVIGLSPSEYGFLAVYIGAAIVIASSLNTQLLHRFTPEQLIRFGFSLMILSGFSMLFFHFTYSMTKWTLLGPVTCFFCYLPFAGANSAAKAMSQINEHFGSAGAILATMQFLFGCAGALLFSWIPDRDMLPLALSFLLTGCLLQLTMSLATKHERATNL